MLRVLTPGTEAAGSGDNVLPAKSVPLRGQVSPGSTGPREERRAAVTHTLRKTEITPVGADCQGEVVTHPSPWQLAEPQAQSPAAGPQQGGPLPGAPP